jgi:hypothetical protein
MPLSFNFCVCVGISCFFFPFDEVVKPIKEKQKNEL